jgi:hypothetical protein
MHSVNAALLALALVVLFMGASELGFRVGGFGTPSIDADSKSLILAIASAMLAMVGLLLGFSFSMAAGRFESRREVMIDEGNAIGTCYLRAGLLADAERDDVRQALRGYIDARIAIYGAGNDVARVKNEESAAAAAQEHVWRVTAAAARREPRAMTSALMIQSLNEMIDLDSKRAAIFRNRVPTIIPALLVVTAFLGMAGIGYDSAIAGRRRPWLMAILGMSLAAIIFVIIDLDRPWGGTIRVGQEAMIELRERIDRASR